MSGFWRLMLACLLLAALLPLVADRYTLFVGNAMLVQVILAVGLNLLLGCAGLLAFVNGALFGIGAYAVALLRDTLHVPYWLALPAAGVVAMIVGVTVALPALRLSGLYLALATIAFAQFALWAFMHWDPLTGGPSGIKVLPIEFGPLPISSGLGFYYLSLLVAAAICWLTRNLLRSRIGRAFVAIRESETAAKSMAIDVTRTKTLAYALAALYTGIAGGLFAPLLGLVAENYVFVPGRIPVRHGGGRRPWLARRCGTRRGADGMAAGRAARLQGPAGDRIRRPDPADRAVPAGWRRRLVA